MAFVVILYCLQRAMLRILKFPHFLVDSCLLPRNRRRACMLVMVNQARHWRLHVADVPPTNENMAFACWLIARDSQKTNLHYFGPACLLRCNIFLVGPCFLVNHARNRLLAVDYFPLLPRRATLRKACVLCCFTVHNPRNLFVSGPSGLPSFEAPIVIE